jgi:hypothetical protein
VRRRGAEAQLRKEARSTVPVAHELEVSRDALGEMSPADLKRGWVPETGASEPAASSIASMNSGGGSTTSKSIR